MGAPMIGLQPLREILGLTGDQLAAHLHVNPRTVRSWEQGRDPVPEGVWAEVDTLLARAQQEVDRVTSYLATGVVPSQPGWYPDRYWRHILARAYLARA